jgi:hypothetical protein
MVLLLMSLLGRDDWRFHVLVIFWGCNVINPCFTFNNTLQKLLLLIGMPCQMHESPILWALLFSERFFGTQHAHNFLLTVWSWTMLCALYIEMFWLSDDVSELNASVPSSTGNLHDTHCRLRSMYLDIWVPAAVKSTAPYHAHFPDITCALYTTTTS